MKKIVLSLLLLPLVLITACGHQASEEVVNSHQAVSNDSKDNTTASVDSQPGTQANESSTTATYNGTYYSVQGKYGDVIVVNKKHPIASTYAPGEDAVALASFQNLIADMQAEGFNVSHQYSGFRSYDNQAAIYNGYLANDSQVNVDTYSARPGYSEHQTGLAFDVIDGSGKLLEEPEAAAWLANHAHEYGFIVRYLPGKEASTGYMAESWHVRYIGKEAKDIYDSGLTLEEYFNIPGGDYSD